MKTSTIVWISVATVATIGLGLGLGLGLTLPNNNDNPPYTTPEFPDEPKVFQDLMDTVTIEQSGDNNFYEVDDLLDPTQVIVGHEEMWVDSVGRPTLTVTSPYEYKIDEGDGFGTVIEYDYSIWFWAFEDETHPENNWYIDDTLIITDLEYYSDYADNQEELYINEYMYVSVTDTATDTIYEFIYLDNYLEGKGYLAVKDGVQYDPTSSKTHVITFWQEYIDEVTYVLDTINETQPM